MVSDYVESSYVPCAMNFRKLSEANYALLKDLVSWKKRIAGDWRKITIEDIQVSNDVERLKGKIVEFQVQIDTAGHSPNELSVELAHGPIDLWDNFKARNLTKLHPVDSDTPDKKIFTFKGEIPLSRTGMYGYGIRVTPQFPGLSSLENLDLIIRG